MAWSKKPTDFTLEFLKTADKHVQDATAYALQQVITKSPVDTGAYRGSHEVTINQPATTYRKSDDKSGSSTLAKGLLVSSKTKLGEVVYVQTLIPYGIPIENGHSEWQAPQGVYSLAFQSLANKFK